jgi:hypothetical protein
VRLRAVTGDRRKRRIQFGEFAELGRRRSVVIVDRHVGAKFRQPHRDRVTETAPGSGHQSHFPLQRKLCIHLSPLHPAKRF